MLFHETHNSKGEGLGWRAVTRRGGLVLVGVVHHQRNMAKVEELVCKGRTNYLIRYDCDYHILH